MKHQVFVDTGAWFAAFVPSDSDFPAAKKWLAANRAPLVCTDYVVDELLTLFRVRGENQRAMRVGASLIQEEIVGLQRVSEADFSFAWSLYQRYQDKGWSFTDCTSFAIMERLSIPVAFSFDEHFRQYGKFKVVPD